MRMINPNSERVATALSAYIVSSDGKKCIAEKDIEAAVNIVTNKFKNVFCEVSPHPKFDVVTFKVSAARTLYFEAIVIPKKIEEPSAKKVLILSGSPRKYGNSDLLCEEFMKGAVEAGHTAELIRIAEKKIGFCKGCYACKKKGICITKDDMSEIIQKMIDADVIALASPVYFYAMNAQLKAVIDRSVARWTEIKKKDFYFIITAAEKEQTTFDGTLACMRGFLECCEGSTEKGIICAGGVYNAGEVTLTDYINQAFDMGKNI